MAENWRTSTDALDFLGHNQKRVALEQRRPVVKRASDLVGPGIGANAVRITDFGGSDNGRPPVSGANANVLALFNGYYASLPGALFAPNNTEVFVGTVHQDATYGGVQNFTGVTSGDQYRRVFRRNPGDPDTIIFDPWVKTVSGNRLPDTAFITPSMQNGWVQYPGWEEVGYSRHDGSVELRGLIYNGTTASGTIMFVLPVGFRKGGSGSHLTVNNANTHGTINIFNDGRVQTNNLPGGNAWLSLAGITFKQEN